MAIEPFNDDCFANHHVSCPHWNKYGQGKAVLMYGSMSLKLQWPEAMLAAGESSIQLPQAS